MKKKFIDYFMSIADITAKLSYAKRLQVGAVIVKENQILATGYNGMPADWENRCEDVLCIDSDGNEDAETLMKEGWVFGTDKDTAMWTKSVTRPEVLHAESNALMKVAQSTESSSGATLFCTHAPCIECAKLIYQSGINKVYYRDTYRDSKGLEFLKQGGIDVNQYNI